MALGTGRLEHEDKWIGVMMTNFIPSIKVSLYISGDELNFEKVTRKIGVVPTRTRTKDSFPPQALACNLWSVDIKEENCWGVSVVIEKVLEIFKGKESIINEVCTDYNLETSIEIVIHVQDGDSPEVVLPREVISFASMINAEIGFDLYCFE